MNRVALIRRSLRALISPTFFVLFTASIIAQNTVPLKVEIRDVDRSPLPCRIHLTNASGDPQKAAGLPFWHDHFVCSGQVAIEVAPGRYTYEIERGPEYERSSGSVNVIANQPAAIDATLKRIANLREAGWYSGDLHVHRPVTEMEQLMRAEDLDFAPVITWWNARRQDASSPDKTLFRFDGHRIYTNMAGEDERAGGALLYFGLPRPLDLTVLSREFPSPMEFVRQAHQDQENKTVWIDIEKPFWWDVPTWLASGQMDSIGVANNHMCRSQMLADEAWGKPRDTQRLPDPRGNGFWTQEIYYHILNSGLRIPPSAGSASGVLPNPVGYNRVYVHLGRGNKLSRETWFEALRRGACFVTNGPLLRVRANDRLPGSTLKLSPDALLQIKLDVKLTSNDRVPALEVIHNGRTVETVRCTNDVTQQQTITFEAREPGWFLVRAIADEKETFRFASTAPWYIESGAVQHRISRGSSQFLLDWVDERIQRVRQDVTDPDQRRAVLEPHKKAQEFWSHQVEIANAAN